MVEYGNGLGKGPAGQVGGGGGGGGFGGGSGDWGGQIANAAQDLADQVSSLPPGQLLLLIGVVIMGLWILRRAF
ncbi:MAG: hypothetical protein OEV61_05975 [Chloroflexota bacterium]|jgi:hypothetical protein|nr:hypothetical protein [Chloroflexota bacterium]MDH5243641.1 hypothetical protein [Chloroflexota bacterium]